MQATIKPRQKNIKPESAKPQLSQDKPQKNFHHQIPDPKPNPKSDKLSSPKPNEKIIEIFDKLSDSKKPQEDEQEILTKKLLNTPLGKVLNSSFVKLALPLLGNGASLILNIISAYSNTFSSDKDMIKLATKLGSIGTKIFVLTNGIINSLEQLLFKNYLSMFGNFLDIVISLLVKQSQIYLARGVSLGLYTIANSIGILNNKRVFKSREEHFDHIYQGFKDSLKMLTNKPIENLQSPNTGLLGSIGGFLTLLGFFGWKITGSEKLGATIRDFGGLVIDLEQAKPSHLKEGRPFYFSAGITYIFGTVCDYLSKWIPKHSNALVSLGFATDIIARNFLRISQLYEIGTKKKETEKH